MGKSKKMLIKDLVIPAGTIFKKIPAGTKKSFGEGSFESRFGLSDDSYGTVSYSFDEDDREKEKIDKYFVELED